MYYPIALNPKIPLIPKPYQSQATLAHIRYHKVAVSVRNAVRSQSPHFFSYQTHEELQITPKDNASIQKPFPQKYLILVNILIPHKISNMWV